MKTDDRQPKRNNPEAIPRGCCLRGATESACLVPNACLTWLVHVPEDDQVDCESNARLLTSKR